MNESKKNKYPILGFLITIAIGFGLYYILNNFKIENTFLDYNYIVSNVNNSIFHKILWAIMNFTEPQFYAGVFASIAIILGGFVAWILDIKNSKFKGFAVSYNTNMWPWVLASQVLSLSIAIFVLNYTKHLDVENYTWIPTFITVVGAPPSIMLLYGPSPKALITSSVIGGFISFPIAFWLMTVVNPLFDFPGVVANVFSMAITGVIITSICNALPWIEKKEFPKKTYTETTLIEDNSRPFWFVRRVLADFSEAQFYGNEIAGLFVVIGASMDWFLNINHGTYGAKVLPALILSQFVGSAVGVFLYNNKFDNNGWYATYVPVVSVGPACVLALGANLKVALLAGILGGVIGGPLAEFINKKLPEGYHVTIGNVLSMAFSTIFIYNIIKFLPY